jgi:NTE family protein
MLATPREANGAVTGAVAVGRPRIALVLSGGGARGAYEAGVLQYLLDELPGALGRPVQFDILTGTSVGAVHACYIAATLGAENAGRTLAEVWQSLSAEAVYRLGVTDALSTPFKLLAFAGVSLGGTLGPGERAAGVLNTDPLEELVRARIPWENMRRNIDARRLDALAVAATEVASGRTTVFVDTAGGEVSPWTHDPFVDACATQIGPRHAIASASIPFLFPLHRIKGAYYCDGGLRLNTPLAPALRLGADRVLVIGLRQEPRGDNVAEDPLLAQAREDACTRPTYLAGKVLNALLLDHIDYDLDRLRLFNAILEQGHRTYGGDFLERINEPIMERRGVPYRVVQDLCIRPSRDLGSLAFECADHRPWPSGLRAYITGAMVRYAARGTAGEGDLLSYLLFDHCYAGHLIELGRADAAARREELIAFFSG